MTAEAMTRAIRASRGMRAMVGHPAFRYGSGGRQLDDASLQETHEQPVQLTGS